MSEAYGPDHFEATLERDTAEIVRQAAEADPVVAATILTSKDALSIFGTLRGQYPAGWARTRARLKSAGLAIGAIEKAAGAHQKRTAAAGSDLFADEDGERLSQADILIGLGRAHELFRDEDGRTYARTRIDRARQTWPIRSAGYARILRNMYLDCAGKAPNQDAMTCALNTLDAIASRAPALPVGLRVADFDDAVYVDLADPAWRCIQVDRNGWRVLDEAPIPMRRTAGMLALPEPEAGGSVRELRRFVNLEEEDFPLLIALLVNALRPTTAPYWIGVLTGEQGTGKSYLVRLIRRLIDPSSVAARQPPREVRDLMIAAGSAHYVCYENLSHLDPWLSDGLCTLSTGGGFGTRTLYADAEETLFSARRPILLNGIGDLAARGDLVDRSIVLRLRPIPDSDRMRERDLWREFEEARPRFRGRAEPSWPPTGGIDPSACPRSWAAIPSPRPSSISSADLATSRRAPAIYSPSSQRWPVTPWFDRPRGRGRRPSSAIVSCGWRRRCARRASRSIAPETRTAVGYGSGAPRSMTAMTATCRHRRAPRKRKKRWSSYDDPGRSETPCKARCSRRGGRR